MFFFWLLLCLFSFALMVQLSIGGAIEQLSLSGGSANQDVDSLSQTDVVVVFKNEVASLPHILQDLSTQIGDGLHFVLVNDHSTDEGAALVRAVASNDARFTYIDLPEHVRGKKAALRHVLLDTKAECVILTDADCRISDPLFCQSMRQALNGRDMVVGSGLVETDKNWLTRIYTELVLRQHMLFHAAIAWGLPFMAVGRSMALRRSSFIQAGAMETHLDHPSGTDDLMLQDFVRSGMRVYALPQAVTWTDAPTTVQQWVTQRNRHLSVGDRYPIQALLLVWIVEVTSLLLPFVLVVGVILSSELWYSIMGLLLLLLYGKLTDIISVQFLDAAQVRYKAGHLPWIGMTVSTVNTLISAMAAGQMPKRWKRTV